jgi:5-(carboxyamino)imidazole ribonucleotide synthase
VSFIAARGKQGDMVFYPATENVHWEAILYTSIAPARNVEDALVRQGQQWLADLMNTLDYVGVMAMECFVANEGGKQVLYVNELSPRVHNSGHWTQAGCDTSQFENHIRAIAGFPLGSTRYEGYTAMVNLLGKVTVDMQGLSDNMSLHWYDKQARERRKMGHINIKATQYEQMSDDILRLTKQLNASDPDFPAHHDS